MRRVNRFSMSRLVVVALAAAAIGVAAGWFAGRASLEEAWSTGAQPLTESAVQKLSEGDADPVPKAGSLIIPAKPFTRARRENAELTAADPVRVRIAAVGNGDDSAELHVDVENHAKCTLTEVGGVAHGYDASGTSVKLNKHGEHFVAFSIREQSIEPETHAMLAQTLRYTETASLVVARVDSYACADGTRWARQ